MAHVKLTPEVTGIFKRCKINGNVLCLPPGDLERALYLKVKAALENAGGKWNRFKEGFVFGISGNELKSKLGLILETGVSADKKKDMQAFYTPSELACDVVQKARVSGMSVLEPSAGQGALMKECFAQGATEVHAIEIDPANEKELSLYAPACVEIGDFLGMHPTSVGFFDRVVMNPPFTKDQDIKHVTHAMKFLKPGGRLVAVMSPGWVNSTRRAHQAFHEMVEFHDGEIEEMPAGAFKESGTNIRTVIVTMIKAA